MYSSHLLPVKLFPSQLFAGSIPSTLLFDSITFTDTLAAHLILHPSFSQTITFTDSAINGNVATLSDTITFTDSLSASLIINQSFIQTISFTDEAINGYFEFLTDTLTFTDSVVNTNSAIFSDTITFTQTLSTVLILNRSLTDTIAFTDKVINVHDESFSDTITFSDSIVIDSVSKTIHDTISFSQELFVANILTVNLTDTLNFTDSIPHISQVRHITFTDNLNLNSTFSTILGSFVHPFHDKINFVDTVNFTIKHLGVILENSLTFTDSISLNRKNNIVLIDTLIFYENQRPFITDFGSFNIPVLIPIVTKPTFKPYAPYITGVPGHRSTTYITLESKSSIILLPNALFGDSQKNVMDLKINRAVDGTIYTLIKKTKRQKLNYKFELKRQKSRELQDFIDINIFETITLTNWKSEVWIVKFTNNPIVYTANARGYICPNNIETHIVDLEFDGFLLNVGNYVC